MDNNIKYFHKLKNEVRVTKFSYTPELHCKNYKHKYYFYTKMLNKIFIKRPKYLKKIDIAPFMFNIKKAKYYLNNTIIDYFEYDFNFFYYTYVTNATPIEHLLILINLIKMMNIKKLVLNIVNVVLIYQQFNDFFDVLKRFMQICCNDMHIFISYENSINYNSIRVNERQRIINNKLYGNYTTIDKTRANYHRNFKIQQRLI